MSTIRGLVIGSKWFSTLDFRETFFQIRLHEDSKALTAFGATGTKLMQHKVIPMGLTVRTSMLHSGLTRLLAKYIFISVVAY